MPTTIAFMTAIFTILVFGIQQLYPLGRWVVVMVQLSYYWASACYSHLCRVCRYVASCVRGLLSQSFVGSGRQCGVTNNLYLNPTILGLSPESVGYRSWGIIQDVAARCRVTLGLDRSTDPSDAATRVLVKKTVWGILTDNKLYPDLRSMDAVRLVPYAAEIALSPTMDEIESLHIATHPVLSTCRQLARGEWRVEPSSWWAWIRSLFRTPSEDVYLPAVSQRGF